jgi:uncharacterized BrkB/YihY/UPF0761 family membrane protein
MGISGFFRTEAFYDYNPDRGLKFYERQLFSFNIMFLMFRLVVYAVLALLSLATLIALFNLRWQFIIQQAVPSFAIIAVFLLAVRFMAKYRAYLAERVQKMRELMKSGEMDNGDFPPEDVDWT